MDLINEHLDDALHHLCKAAQLVEHQFNERYCIDVPQGRIGNLLHLSNQLHELRRMAGNLEALAHPTAMVPDAPPYGAVSAGGRKPAGDLDAAA
jgi:hypothetical protein